MDGRRKGMIATVGLAVVMMFMSGCELMSGGRGPDYQEVGIIQVENRFVPTAVNLEKGKPARLHIANGSVGSACAVSLEGIAGERMITQGHVTTIELSRDQVDELDGKKLRCPSRGTEVIFRVVKKGERVSTSGGEVAVVMTDTLAAPREITVTRGVPVTLYVTKTVSDAGVDTFVCDHLGIKIDVADGEVTKAELKPTETGSFVFVGTVTPDSRVTVHVVDEPTK